ncbi:hypothetical protein JVT61DRAFT_12633 [Boletus reticuloceps]|uniref:HNH nuclease domain-containing protein n=1 Tax=Boletus reticuloceps TaxID=495285 RepID=A0A8I3ACG7_9AGAM|nr:hypothetical protein JVT61DRAFT_12633 [Boletus reticuloceps]
MMIGAWGLCRQQAIMMENITTSPLPPFNSPQIQELCSSNFSDHSSAYNIILEAENYANQQSQEDIMFARVAGFLLLEFHSRSHIFGHLPCTSLVRRVTSQSSSKNQHDVVFHVGKLYCDSFICLFRTFDATTSSYSPPYSHPSCSSFNTLEEMIKDTMEATAMDYQTLGRKALARDGCQCLVTGLLDLGALDGCAELRAMAKCKGKAGVQIEAAHILNASTIQCIDPTLPTGEDSVVQTQHAADTMAILESFGFSEFTKAFKQSGGIHQVWNLLSLQHDINYNFGKLDMWFESTDQLGHYELVIDEPHKSFIHGLQRTPDDGAPIIVNFPSYGAEVPPPSPGLLALHATCARVAHMSGAAEFFYQLEEDIEDSMQVDVEEYASPCFHGSSVHTLSNMLSSFEIND